MVVVRGVTAAGYFWLWPRAEQQNAPTEPQQLISTFPGSPSAASFSPDGNRIAYINQVNGISQVWIKDLAGGEPVLITPVKRTVARGGHPVVMKSSMFAIPRAHRAFGGSRPGTAIIEGGRNPNWSG